MTIASRLLPASPLSPPYLVTTGTDRPGALVGVTADSATVVVEMAPHGPWTSQLCGEVAASLHLCMAGPSASLIVDLSDVGDPHGAGVPFWTTAVRTAQARAIPVQLVFSLPAGSALDYRLRRMDGFQPPVFTTMAEARAAIAGRLAGAPRIQARLTPEPASVPAARELATRACQAWDLLHLRHTAELVVSELASNAVEHARTGFVVTVSKGGPGLHLAVRDKALQYPHPKPLGQAPLAERGRGLHLVQACTAAWGAMPARGGKVVWATVLPEPPAFPEPPAR